MPSRTLSHRSKNRKSGPTYGCWTQMIYRCYRPLCRRYPNYGGRGITVCDRWRASYDDFVSDMGEKPPGLTIDRANNDGNYEPSNCRWATVVEQGRNRRTNRLLSFNGESLTISEWAERLGWHKQVIRQRLEKGWSVEESLTAPPDKHRPEILLTLNGVTVGMAEWSRRLGIPRRVLSWRKQHGWTDEKSLTTPLRT